MVKQLERQANRCENNRLGDIQHESNKVVTVVGVERDFFGGTLRLSKKWESLKGSNTL